jgi:hypothetical protein
MIAHKLYQRRTTLLVLKRLSHFCKGEFFRSDHPAARRKLIGKSFKKILILAVGEKPFAHE